MPKYILTIAYNNQTIETSSSYSNNDLQIIVDEKENSLQVYLEPKLPITIQKAYITIPYLYKDEYIFLNGYQSWSDCHEVSIHSYDKGLQKVPAFLDKKYAFSAYGDYRFYSYPKKKGILHSWNYTYVVKEGQMVDFYGSTNENDCYTSFTHNSYTNELRIDKDICDYTLQNEMKLFSLVHYTCEKKQAHDMYFEACGLQYKEPKRILGYTSWYNHYENINDEKIQEAISEVNHAPIPFDVFQIDDGYQKAVGDWMKLNEEKFPHGLQPIINRVHGANKQVGIWMAPFVCEKNSDIYQNHPEMLARDENGEFIQAGHNWSFSYVLDYDKKEVRDYIKACLQHYANMGFDFFKLDFLYAIGLLETKTMTRAARLRDACEFLRECLPNKVILGCGVPLFAVSGIVEYCRVGCDVGLDYDNTWFMRLFHRERVSTKNTILNTIYRSYYNGYFFGNDPDVIIIRDSIKLTHEQQLALLKINTLCAPLVFTSDNVKEYRANTIERLHDNLIRGVQQITYETKDSIVTIHADNQNYTFDIQNGILKEV